MAEQGTVGPVKSGSPSFPGFALSWLPVALLLTGALLSILLFRSLAAWEERVLELTLEDEALYVAAEMRGRRLRQVAAFARAAQRVLGADQPDAAALNLESELLLTVSDALDVLIWVHTGDGEPFVFFRAGVDWAPEPVLIPDIRLAMEDAASLGEERYVAPISYGAMEGEAVVLPVFKNERVSYLIAISRLPGLLEELLGPFVLERYFMQIDDGLGRRIELGPEPEIEGVFSAPVPIGLEGLPWRVRVGPAGARWRAMPSALPILVLGFGLLTSFLLAASAFGFGLARRRALVAEAAGKRLGLEIEQRKTAEERLRRNQVALEKVAGHLQRSNEDLQRFGAVIAHDLKEPLLTVRMYAEEIFRGLSGKECEEVSFYATRIQAAATKMAVLIDALLSHARVTSGEVSFETVDLADVVDEVLDSLRSSLEESGGRVQVERLPLVEADRSQMRQLFQNLIANSLKFRRREVAPLVEISAKPAHASANGRGPWWTVSVKDNGIGLKKDEIGRLFVELGRLSSASEYEGTGMGLAICRRIVERHGGGIRASPRREGGASMELVLPSRQLAAEEPAGSEIGLEGEMPGEGAASKKPTSP